MKRSLIALSVVSLLFAGVAGAEVRRGDVLLDAAAGWTQQDFEGGGDVDIFFGLIRPGYAFTDNIRGAVVGAVAHVDSDAIGDVTTFALGVSGEYVFMPANQFNPYVGGMFAWADADTDAAGDTDGWLFGPRVGFLYTLNTTNNLFGEFQYHFWGGDIDDVLDDGFMVLFGIEHKFKVGL